MSRIQFTLQSTREAGKTFIQNNRPILEPLAIATGVAVVVVGSAAAGQALLLSKGAAATGAIAVGGAKSALPVKVMSVGGTTSGKTAGASVPALLQNVAQNGLSSVNNTVSTLNQTATSSMALVDKLGGLANTIQANAPAFLVGAAGGGAAGVGVGAQQKRQTDARLREQETQLQAQQDQLTELQAATAAQSATLATLQTAPAPSDLEQPAPSLPEVEPPEPDRLVVIKGIGPVYAKLLNDAGITTFAQLAQQTPEQLDEILGAEENSRMADVEDWIEQAQALADNDQSS